MVRWLLMVVVVGCASSGQGDTGGGVTWVDDTFPCEVNPGEEYAVLEVGVPRSAAVVVEAEYPIDQDRVAWVNYADTHEPGSAVLDCFDGLRARVAYADPADLLVWESVSGDCGAEGEGSAWVNAEIPAGALYRVEVERDGEAVPASVLRLDATTLEFSCVEGAAYTVSYAEA